VEVSPEKLKLVCRFNYLCRVAIRSQNLFHYWACLKYAGTEAGTAMKYSRRWDKCALRMLVLSSTHLGSGTINSLCNYNLDAGTAVLYSIYKHMRQDVKLYCNFDNMGDKWSEANFNNIWLFPW